LGKSSCAQLRISNTLTPFNYKGERGEKFDLVVFNDAVFGDVYDPAEVLSVGSHKVVLYHDRSTRRYVVDIVETEGGNGYVCFDWKYGGILRRPAIRDD
jgi:hypothetical protein